MMKATGISASEILSCKLNESQFVSGIGETRWKDIIGSMSPARWFYITGKDNPTVPIGALAHLIHVIGTPEQIAASRGKNIPPSTFISFMTKICKDNESVKRMLVGYEPRFIIDRNKIKEPRLCFTGQRFMRQKGGYQLLCGTLLHNLVDVDFPIKLLFTWDETKNIIVETSEQDRATYKRRGQDSGKMSGLPNISSHLRAFNATPRSD
jgi:hypothetical protein